MSENFKNLFDSNVTIMSNEFLDKHLSDCNPEYLKVYIYYLWKCKNKTFTYEEVADDLSLTENDVEKAVKYWIKQKVISKDIICKNQNDNLIDFTLVNNHEQILVDNNEETSFNNEEQKFLNTNEESVLNSLNDVLSVAEKLLPNTISKKQVDAFTLMITKYNLPVEVIQYLIEYLSDKDKNKITSNYMLSVANSLYEIGAKNIDDAKKYFESLETKTSITKLKKNKKVDNKIIDYNKLYYGKILK